MAFTFTLTSPPTDLYRLRVIVGDTVSGNGPTPGMGNLDDTLLTYWLSEAGGDVNSAAVMAFDHLAALWISRPIFGPGELSTVHTNMAPYYQKMADRYRALSSHSSVSAAVVRVGEFTKADGFTPGGSEYT